MVYWNTDRVSAGRIDNIDIGFDQKRIEVVREYRVRIYAERQGKLVAISENILYKVYLKLRKNIPSVYSDVGQVGRNKRRARNAGDTENC